MSAEVTLHPGEYEEALSIARRLVWKDDRTSSWEWTLARALIVADARALTETDYAILEITQGIIADAAISWKKDWLWKVRDQVKAIIARGKSRGDSEAVRVAGGHSTDAAGTVPVAQSTEKSS